MTNVVCVEQVDIKMRVKQKQHKTAEFGDFQTPPSLAAAVCAVPSLHARSFVSVIEPTCGIASFLVAALERFSSIERGVGVDINEAYIDAARITVAQRGWRDRTALRVGDFFQTDWKSLLSTLPDPLLVIGNPPWVTNSALSVLASDNLPQKTKIAGLSGLAALTGKSNFDISEWILMHLLECLDGRSATLAMLCKTTVARKVLRRVWQQQLAVTHTELRRIDAARFFQVAVDACLLVCELGGSAGAPECSIYDELDAPRPSSRFGLRDGKLIADLESYERWKHLGGGDAEFRWRSGVKHDCTPVMVLIRESAETFRNGLGEAVELESDYLYPMLKCSELARGETAEPSRWMLVPQRSVGQATDEIRQRAPKTGRYLETHAGRLAARRSSIYHKQPRYAIFGVGEYSFAPARVAISGLHKKLHFTPVGAFAGKPIMLDDTSYGLACRSLDEAQRIATQLNSDAARAFLSSMIFWDAKRPITTEVLNRLNLQSLEREIGSAG